MIPVMVVLVRAGVGGLEEIIVIFPAAMSAGSLPTFVWV